MGVWDFPTWHPWGVPEMYERGIKLMAMRVLVTDGMDAGAMEQLRRDGYEVVEQFYEPDMLGTALRDFDAVIIRSATKIKEPQIDAAKGGRLKLIIRAGVGVDNIAVPYAEAAGIQVRNTPRASSNAVAELALALLFSCARNISIAGHTMRENKWEKKAYSKGFELSGKTVGVIGYGRIGRLVGEKAQALGCLLYTSGMVGVGVNVDVLGLQLGIQDRLAGIQSVIAGEHIADAAGQSKVQKPAIPEQLHRQENGGHRAVHRPTEHRHQAHRRRKARRQSQQRACHAAKGGSHKEGGHHLAALKAGAQREGGKQDLQQKSRRAGSPFLHSSGNDLHSGAVVIRASAQ